MDVLPRRGVGVAASVIVRHRIHPGPVGCRSRWTRHQRPRTQRPPSPPARHRQRKHPGSRRSATERITPLLNQLFKKKKNLDIFFGVYRPVQKLFIRHSIASEVFRVAVLVIIIILHCVILLYGLESGTDR